MNKVAILFGVLLIGLGLYGYLGQSSVPSQPETANSSKANQAPSTEPTKASPTALIPAAFGLLLLVCGFMGLNPASRKTAMHVAAGVAALGAVLGGGKLATSIGPLLSGDPPGKQRAAIFTGLMALICLIYVVISVQSFIAARRSRTAKSA